MPARRRSGRATSRSDGAADGPSRPRNHGVFNPYGALGRVTLFVSTGGCRLIMQGLVDFSLIGNNLTTIDLGSSRGFGAADDAANK